MSRKKIKIAENNLDLFILYSNEKKEKGFVSRESTYFLQLYWSFTVMIFFVNKKVLYVFYSSLWSAMGK